MKYIVYIDYRTDYKPMKSEYRVLNAKTISEAIIEVDAIHDPRTMYLVQIMNKSSKVERVSSDLKASAYTSIMEKRSTRWAAPETNHVVKHFVSKYGDWFETV